MTGTKNLVDSSDRHEKSMIINRHHHSRNGSECSTKAKNGCVCYNNAHRQHQPIRLTKDDTTTARSAHQNGFNHRTTSSGGKYCCYGKLHIRLASGLLACLHTLILMIVFARIFYSTLLIGQSLYAFMPVILSGTLLATGCTSLAPLLVGVTWRRQLTNPNPHFLTPFILHLMLAIMVCVACFVFLGISFAVASIDVTSAMTSELPFKKRLDKTSYTYTADHVTPPPPNLHITSSFVDSASYDANSTNKELGQGQPNNNYTHGGTVRGRVVNEISHSTSGQEADLGLQISIGYVILSFLSFAVFNFWVFKTLKSCQTYLRNKSRHLKQKEHQHDHQRYPITTIGRDISNNDISSTLIINAAISSDITTKATESEELNEIANVGQSYSDSKKVGQLEISDTKEDIVDANEIQLEIESYALAIDNDIVDHHKKKVKDNDNEKCSRTNDNYDTVVPEEVDAVEEQITFI